MDGLEAGNLGSLRNPSLSWTGGGEIRPQQMGALGLECYVENSSAAAGALPAEAAAVAPNSVVGPRATQLEEEEGDETGLWTWLWLLLPVPRSAAGPDAEIIADFLALGSKLVQRMVDRGADPVILSTVLQELSWDRHRRDYMEGCQDYLDCLGLPFEAGCQRSREIEPHDRDVLVAEELWDYFVGYLEAVAGWESEELRAGHCERCGPCGVDAMGHSQSSRPRTRSRSPRREGDGSSLMDRGDKLRPGPKSRPVRAERHGCTWIGGGFCEAVGG